MSTLSELRQKFRSVWPLLDERTRRLMAANEAVSLGDGGISQVHRASGLSRKAIANGIREIQKGFVPGEGRIRRPGAGRKSVTVSDPRLVQALEEMIDCQTRGDPQSPLRWICKSTRAIAKQLGRQKHPVSHTKIAQILHDLNYSLQSARKTEEGVDHPDRDAQFQYINAAVKTCLAQGVPVISVDTKKKELIGNYSNTGQQWRPVKQPIKVQDHDFPGPEVPRAYPYGIYDIGRNVGFVNVGTDHDTGAFAVASIRGWWRFEGRRIYPQATTILITADGGGSNGSRLRLWKLELQKFADQAGLCLSVCHFPPGTSKWNKIEHRLFSQITLNWRGRPLTSHQVIVDLIGATRTATGLTVRAELDTGTYPTGVRYTKKQVDALPITGHDFHSEWNYTVTPSTADTPTPT